MKTSTKINVLGLSIIILASMTWANTVVWTPVNTAQDVENFFVASGEWAAIGSDDTIPVSTQPYVTLPSEMMTRALATVTNTLRNEVQLAADDPHLSASAELYAWNQFTVNLLNQDCGNFNEVGYFVYKVEEDGSLYLGECGIIYKYVNNSAGPTLGIGNRIVFKQRYNGYVRVGFWLRSKKDGWSPYYSTKPMARAIFSVEAFNNIDGKEWYNSNASPVSYPTTRKEFTYIFDQPTAKSLFPESARPTIFAFEDDYFVNYLDGWPSDWDYNDVVFVCGPVFREYETNLPPVSTVSGLVWKDYNQDGYYDSAAEPLIEGLEVKLLDALGAVVATTTTDINGTYRFLDIEDVGTFFVKLDNDNDEWAISPYIGEETTQHANDFYPDTGISHPLVLEGDTHKYKTDLGIIPAQPPTDC